MLKLFTLTFTAISLISFSAMAETCPSGTGMSVVQKDDKFSFSVIGIPNGYSLSVLNNPNYVESTSVQFSSAHISADPTYYYPDVDYVLARRNVNCYYTFNDQPFNRIILEKDGTAHFTFRLTPPGWGFFDILGSQYVSCGNPNCDFTKVKRN